MPIRVTTTTGGTGYTSAFVGRPGPIVHNKVDITGMTTDEVDSSGYLKPGVCLSGANPGVLVGANVAVYGVTVEAVYLGLATIPPTNTSLAAETVADPFVAVATSGMINRDIWEDNMGRALSANEIAGLTTLAGSRFQLTRT